jgi:hypothetical protein
MSRLALALRWTGIVCALVGWFSSSVGADPIRSSLRFVQGTVAAETSTRGSFGPFSLGDDTDGPGLFNSVVTDELGSKFDFPTVASYTATQHTDVSASRWSGSGTASTFTLEGDPSFGGGASAESGMLIRFSLLEPMSYLLTGSISGQGGSAVIRLDGPPRLGWQFESGNAVPVVAMRRGLLSPGEYSFEARASSSGDVSSGKSAFDVQFTLADPVPEPATLLLFSTGAALVGRTAWRRRREQGNGSSDES